MSTRNKIDKQILSDMKELYRSGQIHPYRVNNGHFNKLLNIAEDALKREERLEATVNDLRNLLEKESEKILYWMGECEHRRSVMSFCRRCDSNVQEGPRCKHGNSKYGYCQRCGY